MRVGTLVDKVDAKGLGSLWIAVRVVTDDGAELGQLLVERFLFISPRILVEPGLNINNVQLFGRWCSPRTNQKSMSGSRVDFGVPSAHARSAGSSTSRGSRVSSSLRFVRSRYLEETCAQSAQGWIEL